MCGHMYIYRHEQFMCVNDICVYPWGASSSQKNLSQEPCLQLTYGLVLGNVFSIYMVYYSLVVSFLQQRNTEPIAPSLLSTDHLPLLGKAKSLPLLQGQDSHHPSLGIAQGSPSLVQEARTRLSDRLSVPTPSFQEPFPPQVEHRFWWSHPNGLYQTCSIWVQ